jgi:hypothetical protein
VTYIAFVKNSCKRPWKNKSSIPTLVHISIQSPYYHPKSTRKIRVVHVIQTSICLETNLNQRINSKKLSGLNFKVQNIENKLNKKRRRYKIKSILHGENHVIESTWNQIKKGKDLKIDNIGGEKNQFPNDY